MPAGDGGLHSVVRHAACDRRYGKLRATESSRSMIARRSLAQRFWPTISVPDYLELRGLLLSHFVGIALAVPFVLHRVLLYELPYTRPIDVPLYLVAIWL